MDVDGYSLYDVEVFNKDDHYPLFTISLHENCKAHALRRAKNAAFMYCLKQGNEIPLKDLETRLAINPSRLDPRPSYGERLAKLQEDIRKDKK